MVTGRPLILLDVDGPINPFRGPTPEGYTTQRLLIFDVRLNPDHGPALLKVAEETGAELAWASTWEHNANEYIGCRIGLPTLPVIEVASRSSRWKFGPVLDYAAGRPLLWFDDDFQLFPEEEEWFLQERMAEAVAGGHSDYTRLHYVDPRMGLTQKDFDKALSWGNNLLQK